MTLEGIIIQKTPYKDKDLICNVLLRSGQKIAVYFYGGRGGGKKAKGSILEVGFMMKITLALKRKAVESNIKIAKEYQHIWNSEYIRDDFRAFYLSSFYLEYIGKIAIESDLDDATELEHAGLFKILSNALYFLDDSLKNKTFDLNTHLFMFLSKLTIELGITPDINNCLYCGVPLSDTGLCLFDPKDGGFACMDCTSKKDEYISDNKLLREEYVGSLKLKNSLKQVYQIPYKDYQSLGSITQGQAIAKFNYINFQFGFTKDQIKSWALISV
jgi:DNA repair protein RecO